MEEPICQLCKTGCEDVFHALMECKVTRKIWKCAHLGAEMKGGNKEDMLSVLHRLFGTLTKTEIEFVAAIWWAYVACKEQIHL